MKRTLATVLASALFLTCASFASAYDWPAIQYLGEVRLFAGVFCPAYDWLPAKGQLLPISSNQALFALFGYNYGGDGKTTFGLPDMSGVLPNRLSAMNWCVAVRGIFPIHPQSK